MGGNSKINLPIKKREEYIKNRTFDDNGDIIEKKCSICNVFKQVGEFHSNKIQFDGTYPHCKVCQREKTKISYWKKFEKEDGFSQSDLDSIFNNDISEL
jgi:hypothetical protein